MDRMEKPTIDVFTVCYNEELMLPYFIRHYLSFCENIYIYDNYSTDKSEEIARQYEHVHIEKFDTGNEFREDITIDLKNNCWKKSKADLVIVCDLDELLYHNNMVRFLKRFKSKGYSIARPIAYDMFSENVPTGNGQIYEEIYRGNLNMFMSKMILFDPHQLNEINFEPGCHYAIPEGHVKLYQKDLALKLLHFKYLSLDYVKDRNKMYQARLSALNIKNGWGFQYHKDYEKSMENHYNEQMKHGEILELIPNGAFSYV